MTQTTCTKLVSAAIATAALFLSCATPTTAQASAGNYLACVATCPNGFSVAANGCRYAQDCGMAILAGEDILPEQCGCPVDDYACLGSVIAYNTFTFSAVDRCEDYLQNYLAYIRDPEANEGAMEDTDEVEDVQCACTDVTYTVFDILKDHFVDSNIEDSFNLCNVVVGYAQEKLAETACATRVLKGVPLLNVASKFCDFVITEASSIVADGFIAVCTNTIGTAFKKLGINNDIQQLLATMEDASEDALTSLANSACGAVACASKDTHGCQLFEDATDPSKELLEIGELPEEVCTVLGIDAASPTANSVSVALLAAVTAPLVLFFALSALSA